MKAAAAAPTLVILAAGSARRYGSLKQLAEVGPNGEALLEYSAYDAMLAGFRNVVLVIQADLEDEFRSRLEGMTEHFDVTYTYQRIDDLPARHPSDAHPTRTKPWGTGQAVLAARDRLEGPFAVINADDFYGRSAYQELARFFAASTNGDDPSFPANRQAVVGFPVLETLSKAGPVSRALCVLDEAGNLCKVQELHGVKQVTSSNPRTGKMGAIQFTDLEGRSGTLNGSELVSMNMWGFQHSILAKLEPAFADFLDQHSNESATEPQPEFYLPEFVNRLLAAGETSVKLLRGTGPWVGLTFHQDREAAKQLIDELINQGSYPNQLWC